MTARKKKNVPTFRRRTIKQELHEAWQRHRRTGDDELIAKELGVSKYTINNALAYGFVHREEVINGITNFFAERYRKENELAKSIQ